MFNIFEFSWVLQNVEAGLLYANKGFWIAEPYFLTDTIKRSSCQILFLPFKNFYEKKTFWTSIIVLIVMIWKT